MSEHEEQAALVRWARTMAGGTWPELRLLFAVPNGGSRPSRVNSRGERYSPSAQRLADEGVRAGVPDLVLPVARGGYHGLFIEMKAGKNTTTEGQRWWIGELVAGGYRVAVCHGWEAARDVLVEYLSQGLGSGRASAG